MTLRVWLTAALAASLLVGCPDRPARRADPGAGGGGSPVPPPRRARVARTTLEALGLDPAAIDDAVSPCDDFQRFACGGRDAGRPPRRDELAEQIDGEVRQILEGSTEPAAAFYRACMDEATNQKLGRLAIDDLIDAARAVRDRRAVLAAVASLHERGIWPLFSLRAAPDPVDAGRVILVVEQGGLGMAAGLYTGTDETAKAARVAYRARVEAGLALMGQRAASARRAAADVLRIETALARATRPAGEFEDPAARLVRLDRAGLEALAPRFAWREHLRALGWPDLHDIAVDAPAFLAAVNRLLGSERATAWRGYLEWSVARAMAGALPPRFAAIDGGGEALPRWRRCVAATVSALPDDVGRAFAVAAHIDAERGAVAARRVRELSLALGGVLRGTAWMGPDTRQRAVEKLAALDLLVGAPRRSREPLPAIGAVHAANVLSAQRVAVRRALATVGAAVDRTEWIAPAVTGEPRLDLARNQLALPAGLLQLPQFAEDAHPAVSFGGAGVLIAAALLRGFDATGGRFDGDGNLAAAWPAAETDELRARGGCVAARAGAADAEARAEAIAEQGALLLAFRAYRAVRAGVRLRTVVDPFDEDQLFFLAAAQARCGDPPARSNAPMSALPEFHRAWSCETGGAMRPSASCRVW